jgi:hypothetical protein
MLLLPLFSRKTGFLLLSIIIDSISVDLDLFLTVKKKKESQKKKEKKRLQQRKSVFFKEKTNFSQNQKLVFNALSIIFIIEQT